MRRKSPIQRNRFMKRGQKYRCCPRIVPVRIRSNWYVGVMTRILKGQNTHGDDESRSMPRLSRTGPEIHSAKGPLMLKVSMTIRNWNLDSKPHLCDFGVFFNMWWTHYFRFADLNRQTGLLNQSIWTIVPVHRKINVATFATSSEPGGCFVHTFAFFLACCFGLGRS